MKATQAKDLVIGKIYSDIKDLKKATFIKYKGIDDGRYAFEYVAGSKFYGTGKITFSDLQLPWQSLSPSEIEQYLPKEKL